MPDVYVDVTLRLPEQLLMGLLRDAEREGVSLSAYVAVLCTEGSED